MNIIKPYQNGNEGVVKFGIDPLMAMVLNFYYLSLTLHSKKARMFVPGSFFRLI
jgi:hypothetical protein